MFDINTLKLITRTCLSVVFITIILFRSAYAVKLHPLFQDNVVLQFGKKVNVWGTADRGETVSVSINDQTRIATAINGQWLVQLEPMGPGGPYILTVKGTNTITVKNVRIGDVWIVSGQSNAYTAAGAISECVEGYETFQSEDVRLMSIAPTPADEPMNFPRNYIISGLREKENRMHLYNQWYACTWDVAREFSAMGLAHAIKIHQETGIPTAVIQCVMGSTKIEHWIPYWALETSEFSGCLSEINKNPLPETRDRFPRDGGVHELFKVPTYCFNGMVAPITPFTISGVIWLQGESNIESASQVGDLMHVMIKAWRKEFKDEFAFIPVQTAGWTAITTPWEGGNIAMVREGQARVLELTNTGLATAIDFAEEKIHHHGQGRIGWRTAAVALRLVHGKDIVGAGPWLTHIDRKVDGILLTFAHTGSGLMAVDNRFTPEDESGKLLGFGISGSDGRYTQAQATIISSNQVEVSGVSNPKNVRYAYSMRPVANLYNREGFPAFPFRTEKLLKGNPAPLVNASSLENDIR